MCLITRQVKPEVAEEDIVCYKNLASGFGWQTPYMNEHVSDAIIKGMEPLVAKGSEIRNGNSGVGPGYIHVHTNRLNAEKSASYWGDFVFKAIIPKGIKYYTSTSGEEMCAEKIMFVSQESV